LARAARRGFAVWRIGLARAKKIMNSKNNSIWFVVAAALGIFIFAFEHYFHFAASAQAGILPRLQPDAVTGVQVIPSGAPEICVARTNGNGF